MTTQQRSHSTPHFMFNHRLFRNKIVLAWLVMLVWVLVACAAQTVSPTADKTSGDVGIGRVVGTQMVMATPSPAAFPTFPGESLPAPQAPEAYPGLGRGGVVAEGESGFAQPILNADTDTANVSVGGPSGQMVIKDADIALLVRDTDQTLARVVQLAADRGGYIISTQTWFQDGFKYATVRLGIPSSTFEVSLNSLRVMALQVTQETTSGQDVSADYTDLQTRLANLEATATRVREFLKDAKTVEESLRINQQLSELEGQIAQIKGQMNFYEGRSTYSTITVHLTPEYPTPTPSATPTTTPTPTPTTTPTPTPQWSPRETFDEASGTLNVILRFLAEGLIWITVVGGPFIVLGLGLYGVWRLIARRK